MTSRNVMMEGMSWPEFGEAVKRDPVVFIPCGATEQHGPHLPLSVDALLSADVCREVAEEVGGVVTPPISFGYKSMPRSGGTQSPRNPPGSPVPRSKPSGACPSRNAE